jgi:carbon monoxide dehydrogenase subunit G
LSELVVTVDVRVPADRAWEALTDWENQGEWMLGTRVRGTAQNGRGVGGGIEGWTGVGPLGFLDTMVITVWEPPHRCLVDHTGRVVRGTGGFEVAALGDGRCRVLWFERVDVPFGGVGRIGWPLLRPVVRWGVARSLRNFKRRLEKA